MTTPPSAQYSVEALLQAARELFEGTDMYDTFVRRALKLTAATPQPAPAGDAVTMVKAAADAFCDWRVWQKSGKTVAEDYAEFMDRLEAALAANPATPQQAASEGTPADRVLDACESRSRSADTVAVTEADVARMVRGLFGNVSTSGTPLVDAVRRELESFAATHPPVEDAEQAQRASFDPLQDEPG